MKKALLLAICVTMITAFTGCGNTNEIENTSDAVVEENVIEAEPSEETVTVEEEVPAEPVEEVVPEKEEEKTFADTGLTEEYAAEKFARAMSAYTTLRDNREKAFEANATCCMFTGDVYGTDVESKDGFNVGPQDADEDTIEKIWYIYCSMFVKYFDEFINNNGEYYDFAEYYASHNSTEILDYYNIEIINNDTWEDTSQIYLANMVWLESITGETSLKNITDDVSVNYKTISMPYNKTVDAAWQCDIYMDGEDTGLKLLFDKDGNLLNINDENRKIEKIVPFKTN